VAEGAAGMDGVLQGYGLTLSWCVVGAFHASWKVRQGGKEKES